MGTADGLWVGEGWCRDRQGSQPRQPRLKHQDGRKRGHRNVLEGQQDTWRLAPGTDSLGLSLGHPQQQSPCPRDPEVPQQQARALWAGVSLPERPSSPAPGQPPRSLSGLWGESPQPASWRRTKATKTAAGALSLSPHGQPAPHPRVRPDGAVGALGTQGLCALGPVTATSHPSN